MYYMNGSEDDNIDIEYTIFSEDNYRGVKHRKINKKLT